MRVKRYIVDTLPDAVTLIRNELGKDAVILETKDVKIGGFLGMFRKKKIEVMAAVEPNANKDKGNQTKSNANDVNKVIQQILQASQKNGLPVSQQSESQVSASIEQVPVNSATTNQFGNHAYQQQMKTEPLMKESSSTEQFIVDELKKLRQEMSQLTLAQNNLRSLSPAIVAMKQRLIEQEISDNWIDTLIDYLKEKELEHDEELSVEQVWSYSKDKFVEWMQPYRDATLANDKRIIQFVGPTGVGKTTTIAKLSADYTINKGKSLGLITADTYRIAAVDQLRTYANILNLPLEVVFSPMDLERSLQQLQNVELIFMDTAGRNFKSDIYVSEVNSLLQSNQQSESVLVLSLTSRTKDMSVIAEKFSKYGVKKIVFTKLDEASTYGSIFNMLTNFGLQPLFITSGQNVPDDIEDFSVDHYLDLLLGEGHLE